MSNSRSGKVIMWAGVVGVASTAFVAGRLSMARSIARPVVPAEHVSAPDDRREADQPGRTVQFPPSIVVPAEPEREDSVAAVAAQEARVNRAALLVDQIFQRVHKMSLIDALPSAEAQANAVGLYVQGVLDAAIQTDPRMRPAFATHLQSRLCGGAPRDAEVISVAGMFSDVPDLATPEAFECFFSRAKEDVPLWSMIDAWRHSGLPKTAALSRIEASATDSRTARRFSTAVEEERRSRAGVPKDAVQLTSR